jgi:uncharacterized protein YkwD
MKRLHITFGTAAIVLGLVLGTPLAQGDGSRDETRLALKHELVRMINHDRRSFGLPPVELDPFASVIGDGYCERQIRNGTSGHFTTDGQAPYMRYAFAGGNDGVSENAAAWSGSYKFSDRALYEMMRRSQEAMIQETAPHDGHRRTILDPAATHVGLGLAWQGGEFRLVQEFVRRYLAWNRPLPRQASLGDHVLGMARPIDGFAVEAITVHFEPLPQTLTPAVANLIGSYELPLRRREYLPRLGTRRWRGTDGSTHEVREEYSDGRRGDFQMTRDGGFAFAVPFPDGPGIYTVVVWVRRDGSSDPAISASNVSIRVDSPSGRIAAGSADDAR